MISPRLSSKILYPIDFEINNINKSWYQKQVPTSDSGIIIDTQSTSKSNIEEVRISFFFLKSELVKQMLDYFE
jgi:hypothetical protein